MNENAEVQKGRRKKFLVNRRYQIGWVVRLVLVSLGVMVATAVVLIVFYAHQLDAATNVGGPKLTELVFYMALWFIVLACILVVVGIVATHRSAGPVEKLRQALRDVEQGDYGVRIRLRRNDHWTDLAETFNRAMDRVQKDAGGPDGPRGG